MYFKPTGSVIQLMDGRIFKRNQKNLWEDINSGVTITEQQLNFMVSSASFSSDASSGGGSSRRTTAPAQLTSTSLSAPFDDILEVYESTVTGTNRTVVVTDAGPVTLTVNFEAGGLYSGATIMAYKNDTTQVMNFRTPTGTASPSPRTLTETFANGDQLHFRVSKGANSNPADYDATIEKTAPGSTEVLDTFNVSYAS